MSEFINYLKDELRGLKIGLENVESHLNFVYTDNHKQIIFYTGRSGDVAKLIKKIISLEATVVEYENRREALPTIEDEVVKSLIDEAIFRTLWEPNPDAPFGGFNGLAKLVQEKDSSRVGRQLNNIENMVNRNALEIGSIKSKVGSIECEIDDEKGAFMSLIERIDNLERLLNDHLTAGMRTYRRNVLGKEDVE